MANTSVQNREQFTVKIQCPNCKCTGKAVWEDAAVPRPRGPEPTLISLSDEFARRDDNSLAAAPEVVCKSCGALVLD